MNFRPHPGLSLALATATAIAGTAPLSAPAAADGAEDTVQHCYSQVLTPEQVAAGEESQFDCYEVPEGTPFEVVAGRGTVVLAIVYDVSNTMGDATMFSGASCTGGSVVIGATSGWDNRISATTLFCGSAKHWDTNNFSGTHNQLKTGLGYHTITGTMNNATSSIEYA